MSFTSTLNRKLLRELWQLRTQMLSIALVVACGVLTVVTLRGTYEALSSALERFYRQYRFADVFVLLERAPEPLTARVREIPGVASVQTRIQQLVTLDVEGLDEPALGLLLSIPPEPEETLNDIFLARGTWPRGAHEVLISESFAVANRLEPGDSLSALIEGSWWRLRISGVALSPDFVGEVAPGTLFPDDRRFGILRMRRDVLGPAVDMDGAFNDLSVKLAPGADADQVIAALDRLLERYGGQGAYGRDEQPSHVVISGELNQNRITGTVIPAIFLGVAAFLLNVVLARLVGTQRQEIAVLKAFGYSDLRVGRHYLRFALAAAVLGAVLGIVGGAWIGSGLTSVYGRYFRFPDLEYRLRWELVAIATGVSAVAAATGALSSVRKAVRLVPAEAMRPELPATFRPGPVERLGIGRLLSASGRLIARNLERRGLRSATTVLGVALAEVLVLTGLAFYDSVDRITWLQFEQIQREDVTVAFTHARPSSVRFELEQLPGVYRSELYRTVAVRISFEGKVETLMLTGVSAGNTLRRIVDQEGRVHRVPDHGVMLSSNLADTLGVREGDVVRVEVLEGRRPRRSLVVSAVVDELFGQSVYMDFDALGRMLREERMATGAYLAVDRSRISTLNHALKRLPAIQSVYSPGAARQSFEQQLADSLFVSISFLFVLACVLTVGIVYNGARIALAERGRELASLRVLGFTQREIAVLLLGEQGVLLLIAIPFGWILGVAILAALMPAFETEQFRMPLVVSPRTFFLSAAVTMGAAVLAGWSVRRRLEHLNLVEVLKTRE